MPWGLTTNKVDGLRCFHNQSYLYVNPFLREKATGKMLGVFVDFAKSPMAEDAVQL